MSHHICLSICVGESAIPVWKGWGGELVDGMMYLFCLKSLIAATGAASDTGWGSEPGRLMGQGREKLPKRQGVALILGWSEKNYYPHGFNLKNILIVYYTHSKEPFGLIMLSSSLLLLYLYLKQNNYLSSCAVECSKNRGAFQPDLCTACCWLPCAMPGQSYRSNCLAHIWWMG